MLKEPLINSAHEKRTYQSADRYYGINRFAAYHCGFFFDDKFVWSQGFSGCGLGVNTLGLGVAGDNCIFLAKIYFILYP